VYLWHIIKWNPALHRKRRNDSGKRRERNTSGSTNGRKTDKRKTDNDMSIMESIMENIMVWTLHTILTWTIHTILHGMDAVTDL
jgi:hypothetical protein